MEPWLTGVALILTVTFQVCSWCLSMTTWRGARCRCICWRATSAGILEITAALALARDSAGVRCHTAEGAGWM